jgi:NAD(P)-dependent dehydrogenase (short-subunit alcohol dehydrogenase family)
MPVGRFAQPEEIAPLVVFLASDESIMVTGAIYPIDGGWAAYGFRAAPKLADRRDKI